jgi:RsiW-degrading membrane proteinase PrsW (M82 family)
MSNVSSHNMAFGNVAFSGSRFIFWCLAPLLVLCGIGVPLMLNDWNFTKVVVAVGWSACCLLGVPALYDAKRFWWAARGVTLIIFVCYASYLVHEFFFTSKPFIPTRRSEPSPWNSVLGFAVIGLPALWFTLFGRFSLRAEPQEEEVPRNGGSES